MKIEPENLDELSRLLEDETATIAAAAQLRERTAIQQTAIDSVAKATTAVVSRTFLAPHLAARELRRSLEEVLFQEVMATDARVSNVLRDAIKKGYAVEMEGRAWLYNQSDRNDVLIWEMSEEDETRLEDWPILGRGPDDWSRRHAQQLQWDIEGVVVAPVQGDVRLDLLPGQIDNVQEQHALRIRRLVTDAVLAGAQAARIEWQDVLNQLAQLAEQKRNKPPLKLPSRKMR